MAGKGPLPDPHTPAARRNKPTIPTSVLPAAGRSTPTPDPPDTYTFRRAGAEWWEWAWHTPQAAAWDDGQLYTVARRAQLEDDLHTLDNVDIDLDFLLGEDEDDAARALRAMIGTLKSLATGRMTVVSKMTDLDDRLGLTPKGRETLRWKISDEDATTHARPARQGGRRGLSAVPDASAV